VRSKIVVEQSKRGTDEYGTMNTIYERGYTMPGIFQEYIHRVGRTARGEGSSGHALLILRPEELGFLRYLKEARVPVNEYEFSWNKIADIQLQV